ncbi:MAG: hypothetical protein J6C52_05570, partial [Clostridia bacterium]|nr:hypothetical protein [Clostridia bacterium]
MKKYVTWMLLAAMMLATACGSGAGAADTTAENESGGGTTALDTTGEIAREDTPDSLPADLDFKGQKVRIIYNDDGLASSGAAVNEIEGLENAGDIVNDAVFQRNIKVEERLNIEFEMIANKLSAAAHTNATQKVILAGDDLYDIICGVQYRHVIHALEGLYY